MVAIQPTNKSEKDKILDYVMETPHNTNRQILSNMIDEISESGGVTPSGLVTLKRNMTYDVSSYAEAKVEVPISEYVNSATLRINPEASSYLSGNMCMLQMSANPHVSIEPIPASATTGTTFEFLKREGEDQMSYFLDLEIDSQYIPIIDITQTVGNAPKIALNTSSNKYYLYDLTDGDEVVLTVQKVTGGSTGHDDA